MPFCIHSMPSRVAKFKRRQLRCISNAHSNISSNRTNLMTFEQFYSSLIEAIQQEHSANPSIITTSIEQEQYENPKGIPGIPSEQESEQYHQPEQPHAYRPYSGGELQEHSGTTTMHVENILLVTNTQQKNSPIEKANKTAAPGTPSMSKNNESNVSNNKSELKAINKNQLPQLNQINSFTHSPLPQSLESQQQQQQHQQLQLQSIQHSLNDPHQHLQNNYQPNYNNSEQSTPRLPNRERDGQLHRSRRRSKAQQENQAQSTGGEHKVVAGQNLYTNHASVSLAEQRSVDPYFSERQQKDEGMNEPIDQWMSRGGQDFFTSQNLLSFQLPDVQENSNEKQIMEDDEELIHSIDATSAPKKLIVTKEFELVSPDEVVSHVEPHQEKKKRQSLLLAKSDLNIDEQEELNYRTSVSSSSVNNPRKLGNHHDGLEEFLRKKRGQQSKEVVEILNAHLKYQKLLEIAETEIERKAIKIVLNELKQQLRIARNSAAEKGTNISTNEGGEKKDGDIVDEQKSKGNENNLEEKIEGNELVEGERAAQSGVVADQSTSRGKSATVFGKGELSKSEIREKNLKVLYKFYCKQHQLPSGRNVTFDRVLIETNIMNVGKFFLFIRDFSIVDKNLKKEKILEIYKKCSRDSKTLAFDEFKSMISKLAEAREKEAAKQQQQHQEKQQEKKNQEGQDQQNKEQETNRSRQNSPNQSIEIGPDIIESFYQFLGIDEPEKMKEKVRNPNLSFFNTTIEHTTPRSKTIPLRLQNRTSEIKRDGKEGTSTSRSPLHLPTLRKEKTSILQTTTTGATAATSAGSQTRPRKGGQTISTSTNVNPQEHTRHARNNTSQIPASSPQIMAINECTWESLQNNKLSALAFLSCGGFNPADLFDANSPEDDEYLAQYSLNESGNINGDAHAQQFPANDAQAIGNNGNYLSNQPQNQNPIRIPTSNTINSTEFKASSFSYIPRAHSNGPTRKKIQQNPSMHLQHSVSSTNNNKSKVNSNNNNNQNSNDYENEKIINEQFNQFSSRPRKKSVLVVKENSDENSNSILFNSRNQQIQQMQQQVLQHKQYPHNFQEVSNNLVRELASKSGKTFEKPVITVAQQSNSILLRSQQQQQQHQIQGQQNSLLLQPLSQHHLQRQLQSQKQSQQKDSSSIKLNKVATQKVLQTPEKDLMHSSVQLSSQLQMQPHPPKQAQQSFNPNNLLQNRPVRSKSTQNQANNQSKYIKIAQNMNPNNNLQSQQQQLQFQLQLQQELQKQYQLQQQQQQQQLPQQLSQQKISKQQQQLQQYNLLQQQQQQQQQLFGLSDIQVTEKMLTPFKKNNVQERQKMIVQVSRSRIAEIQQAIQLNNSQSDFERQLDFIQPTTSSNRSTSHKNSLGRKTPSTFAPLDKQSQQSQPQMSSFSHRRTPIIK